MLPPLFFLACPTDIYYSCTSTDFIHNTKVCELSIGFPLSLRTNCVLLKFMYANVITNTQ